MVIQRRSIKKLDLKTHDRDIEKETDSRHSLKMESSEFSHM